MSLRFRLVPCRDTQLVTGNYHSEQVVFRGSHLRTSGPPYACILIAVDIYSRSRFRGEVRLVRREINRDGDVFESDQPLAADLPITVGHTHGPILRTCAPRTCIDRSKMLTLAGLS